MLTGTGEPKSYNIDINSRSGDLSQKCGQGKSTQGLTIMRPDVEEGEEVQKSVETNVENEALGKPFSDRNEY